VPHICGWLKEWRDDMKRTVLAMALLAAVLLASCASAGGLTGQWAADPSDITSICSGMLDFKKDGTLIVHADFLKFSGSYTIVDDDTILIDMPPIFSPVKSGEADFSISDDTLTFTTATGIEFLQRVRANCN
jgi:hypothetical protein